MRKVSIIGGGNVGATAAALIAGAGLADVTILDVVNGLPQGKALDMGQSLGMLDSSSRVSGTNDYHDLAGSDIVVITAGSPRRPGMTRLDLLAKNASVVRSVIAALNEHAPEALLITVTNPLDVMSWLAYQLARRPKSQVMGMGGLLDSARFRFFLAAAAGVSLTEVEGMVIGAHGAKMVPLLSTAKIKGEPAAALLQDDVLKTVEEKTKNGGAEIVGYLKTGSAFYAPGTAVFTMVKAILRDEKKVISTCTLAEGEYGLDGLFINLPAVIGAQGVEEIIEISLSPGEREALRAAAADIKTAQASISPT